MSVSTVSSDPPPIKLAERFLHIIDFHADPITCISASTGTVSYDSIASAPASPIPRAIRPTPQPHGRVRVRNMMKDKLVHLPVTVDIGMFRKVRKEEKRRNLEVSKESLEVSDWHATCKEMAAKMNACMDNFQKDDHKAVWDITVEIQKNGFLINTRTISDKEYRKNQMDSRREVEKVFKALGEVN